MSETADMLRTHLPALRGYARALTGAQDTGDRLLRSWLAAAPAVEQRGGRRGLYQSFNRWLASDDLYRRLNDAALSTLSLRQRQLMLLTAVERFPLEDAAAAVDLPLDSAQDELNAARRHLKSAMKADVLVIEDEPIIALDIAGLVESAGHRVVGIARSHAEAVELARLRKPTLILADVNLGDGGSGPAAVREILASHSAPVVFVTAYPERLLTGEAVEPAFVIVKPFDPTMLAVTTFQALSRFGAGALA